MGVVSEQQEHPEGAVAAQEPAQPAVEPQAPVAEPADADLLIEAATENLEVDRDKVVINIERFGNTTAATIPLALNDAVCSGRLKKGDLVLLASVGAGFTVGALLLRWGF